MAPRYEKVVSNTSFPVLGSLHRGVLRVVVEVGAVGQREGAGLQLLVELGPTEPILLLYIVLLVQTQKLREGFSIYSPRQNSRLIHREET